MKTNIWIKVSGENRGDNCRVKLDANKFPYIVIGNEKIVITSAVFPRTITTFWGYWTLDMELLSGREELELILSNPDLTSDKISLKQQMRLG